VSDGDAPDASGRDWQAWHELYDRDTFLQQRLQIVQQRLREAVDRRPPGPIRLISLCAGEARDVTGALDGHARVRDVIGRLVELDPVLAANARAQLASLGSPLEVVTGDASNTSAYVGAVPADIVVACGIFGNVTDDDVHAIVTELPALCARDATVLWTRHRNAPDLTPTIRSWFTEAGFEELAFDAPGGFMFSIGTFVFRGVPRALVPDQRLFRFVGFDTLLRPPPSS
jgi:hypothetical protein